MSRKYVKDKQKIYTKKLIKKKRNCCLLNIGNTK